MIFEYRKDCSPVEGFIWDHIEISFGNFEGVKKLTFAELDNLRTLVERQMIELAWVEMRDISGFEGIMKSLDELGK